jgi:outer membrane lipoprotein-sorting protein
MDRQIIRRTFYLFVLFFLVAFVNAQETYTAIINTDNFKSSLLNASKNTKTIESEFIQVRSISMLTDKVTSKGRFWFKKPNCIRWEYTSPYSYLIIMSRKKVFIKDDSSKKQFDTQSNKMFKELGVLMLSFIQGNISATENDYTTTYSESSLHYYLKMIPLIAKQKETLSQIDLYFDKTNYSVSNIKLTEPDGDYISIDFVNKTLNKDMSDDVFDFK